MKKASSPNVSHELMKCPSSLQHLQLHLPPKPVQKPNRLLITLNSLLSKLTSSHQYSEALSLFSRIHSTHRLSPDNYTLAVAVTACARLRSPAIGTQLHALALRSGILSFVHVANSLLSFYAKTHGPDATRHLFDAIPAPDIYSYTTLLSAYAKAGRFEDALRLFDGMPHRSTAMWNALITGFIDNGYRGFALELFLRMRQSGVGIDRYTFASVIRSCESPELVRLGRQVHSVVIRTGVFASRVPVINALVTMYFDCELVGDAYGVFGEAMIRDQITYNSLIAGLVRWGRDVEALMVYKEMREGAFLQPTDLTLVSAMSACLCKEIGGQLHAQAIKIGLEASALVGNAAVTMYSGCGDLSSAHQVFESIHDKDIVSWNSLISGYSQGHCYESAISAYHQMQRAGIEPDDFTYGSLIPCATVTKEAEMIQALVAKKGFISSTEVNNAMISAYAKCGEIDTAYRVFCEMPFRNLISWNSIISGCLLNGTPARGLELFSILMKSDIKPNSYTLSTMLSICATMSTLRHGKEIHAYIIRSGSDEVSLANGLITMYAKCGDLDRSPKVFHGMVQRDVVSWNAIIAAHAQNGDGCEATRYFKMMKQSGVLPDQVTFTIALSACSNAGLVDEGRSIFSSMIKDYGIEPAVDHYTCMIDLLGRAGYLEEAERLIKSMSCSVDSSVWWVLLSACSTHGNLRLGRIAAQNLLETEPEDPAIYVLLSNINAADGKWEEALNLREQMRKHGVAKKPGCSWIEDNHWTALTA